jgi:hypothetical protein
MTPVCIDETYVTTLGSMTPRQWAKALPAPLLHCIMEEERRRKEELRACVKRNFIDASRGDVEHICTWLDLQANEIRRDFVDRYSDQNDFLKHLSRVVSKMLVIMETVFFQKI